MSLTDALKDRARALGFCAVGVTGTEPFHEAESAAATRTAEGLLDGLSWWNLTRAHASADPRRAMPDARSVIALAYPPPSPSPAVGVQGGGPPSPIAAYALGHDYHEFLLHRMQPLFAMRPARDHAATSYVHHGRPPNRA